MTNWDLDDEEWQALIKEYCSTLETKDEIKVFEALSSFNQQEILKKWQFENDKHAAEQVDSLLEEALKQHIDLFSDSHGKFYDKFSADPKN